MHRIRIPSTVTVVSVTLLLNACATATPVGAGPGATAGAPATDVSSPAQPVATRWPVKTAEHIDLWLHAFAMLTSDSADAAPIPLYRLGYRDSLIVVRNRVNILSSLDANRVVLTTGLAASSGYLQAQFLPLDMANWDVVRAFAERFLLYEGDPRRAPDKATAARVMQFASIFPSAPDREWLRLFVAAVSDEQLRFFADEHARAVRGRAAVITAVDSLWQRVYRAKFDRFLTNTGQRTGDMVLSLPIGGEGRAGLGRDGQTVVVVPFPSRISDAAEVIFVFAHEVTGSLVATVVADNSTPAELRAGTAGRLVSVGQVRAGAMLLERVAPELLDGYMRFYIAQSRGRVEEASSPTARSAAFARRFELSVTIRDALQRQIEIVLGGI